MEIAALDWAIIGAYFLLALGVGIWASRVVGNSATGFFLAGRNMPWWLLGISMVATTFSTDTPNLVTGLVREQGVSGNWGWWAFLLTGMLTVFVYARLWRRSGVMTDIEFYELRYGGKPAAVLRGFRALYLGLVFNVLVMGTVSLAAIKLGGILLGWPGWLTLLVTGAITLLYSTLGGLRAVILTDFVQFILAMVGSVWACWYILNLDAVGGLDALLAHADVASKTSMFPAMDDPAQWVPILLVPLAVQWWASYYPGAEPGGGGYIAQRMFSAKDESHAVGATLLFNVAHYALRPWPWILIALASIVVFPTLADLQAAFPNIPADKIGHDLAYPAMLSLLPEGLLGLGRGIAAGRLHEHNVHPAQPRCELLGQRLLGALHSTGCYRCGAGACGPIGDRGFVDARQRARFAADGCWASLQPAVAHWRRHRRPVHPALVLVAHQCVDRVGGDGRLVGCCGVFHLRSRRLGHC